MDPHKFHGKDIPHIKLDPKMTIEDLVDDVMGQKQSEEVPIFQIH